MSDLHAQIAEMKKLMRVTHDPESKLMIAQAIIKNQDQLLMQYRAGFKHELPEGIEVYKTTHDKSYPESTLNPDGKSRACQCGARHTSNPNYHLAWCDMREY